MKRQMYYWLVCQDPDTKKVFLIAGGRNEDEARQKGLDMLGGIDFEIRRLPTTNLQSASAMIRGKRLESGEGLRKAKQRLGHNKSINRLRLKRRRDIYDN